MVDAKTESIWVEAFRGNHDIEACEANKQMIEDYLSSALLPLTLGNISTAIDILVGRNALAMRKETDDDEINAAQEYQREQVAKAAALATAGQPTPELTSADFHKMSTEQLREWVKAHDQRAAAVQIQEKRAKFEQQLGGRK